MGHKLKKKNLYLAMLPPNNLSATYVFITNERELLNYLDFIDSFISSDEIQIEKIYI